MKTAFSIALAAMTPFASYAAAPYQSYVSLVHSEKGGLEPVKGSFTTQRDHGGAWMHIMVDDIGSGGNASARLLGSPLRLLKTEPLCNRGGKPAPCTGRGSTIIGSRRTWDASGRDGGNFEYMVIPYNPASVVRVGFQVR